MQLTLRHLLLAFLASLALHALAGIWLPAPEAGAQGAGEGGLLISLAAPGGAPAPEAPTPESQTPEAPAVQPAEEAASEALQEESPEPLREDSPPEIPAAEVPSAAGETTELAEEIRPEQRPTARPEALTASPAQAKSREQLAARPGETPDELREAAETAGEAGSAAPGAGGSSSATSAGGDPGAFNSYLAELMAWLARHKTYPAMAERRRQEGTSELRFTVARDGSLLSYEIARSSGHALLDEASEEMLRRAAPLPAIPPEIAGESLKITAPVVFQLQ